jgi:anti-anti-sigma regulatory factor
MTTSPNREMSGDVVLCSAKPSVNKVFHIVGLPRLVEVLDSLAAARSHLSSRHVA